MHCSFIPSPSFDPSQQEERIANDRHAFFPRADLRPYTRITALPGVVVWRPSMSHARVYEFPTALASWLEAPLLERRMAAIPGIAPFWADMHLDDELLLIEREPAFGWEHLEPLILRMLHDAGVPVEPPSAVPLPPRLVLQGCGLHHGQYLVRYQAQTRLRADGSYVDRRHVAGALTAEGEAVHAFLASLPDTVSFGVDRFTTEATFVAGAAQDRHPSLLAEIIRILYPAHPDVPITEENTGGWPEPLFPQAR